MECFRRKRWNSYEKKDEEQLNMKIKYNNYIDPSDYRDTLISGGFRVDRADSGDILFQNRHPIFENNYHIEYLIILVFHKHSISR